MKYNICKAEYDDLEEILTLQKFSYEENGRRYNNFNIPPLTQTLDDIREEFKKQIFLKAENEKGKIIGSIRAYEENNFCHIGRLMVSPEYQNNGIGSNLLKEIEKGFPNVKKFKLFTGCKDEKNICLYKKNGFSICGEENLGEDFYFVLMEKESSTLALG